MIIPWNEEDLKQSVIERFTWIVKTIGDNSAVVDPLRTYSFNEIDQIAAKLAFQILQYFVSEPNPVAILLSPSANRIAGPIGILKSGHPYVPICISNPTMRNRAILKDAGAKILVTDNNYLAFANEIAEQNCSIINMDNLPEVSKNLPILPKNKYSDPCVIVYTSGSSGIPKGVVHTHESVLYEAMNTSISLALSTDDRFVQVSPMGSIASLSQTMSAVLSGSSSLPFSLYNQSIQALEDLIVNQSVSVFSGTPTVFRNLCRLKNTPISKSFDSLRIVRLGGEHVYPSDASLCFKNCSESALFQVAYGSSETGVICVHTIRADSLALLPMEKLPVGQSVPDKKVLIIDEQLQPLKAGNEGQIVVEGKGLALSYLNQPNLSAKKFKIDRSNLSAPNARYYTGDSGYFNEEGELFITGRKDRQVKINGFRIECAEIEACIMAEPMVAECAVNIFDDGTKEILIAHLVYHSGSKPLEQSLRKSMAERLPRYMIPHQFVVMDSLPMNPNGKVDKNSLPLSFNIGDDLPDLIPDSQISLEQLILIWKQLLKINAISPKDHFFHLGGDSLLMLEMAETLRIRFNKSLHIPTFMQNPTLENLAITLEIDQFNRKIKTVKTGPTNDKTPLVLIGEGQFTGLVAEAMQNIRAVWYFYLPSEIILLAWKKDERDLSIRNLAKIYTDLIIEKIPNQKLHLSGYCFYGILAMEVAHQLEAAGKTISSVILLDARNNENLRFLRFWRLKMVFMVKTFLNYFYPKMQVPEQKYRSLRYDKKNSSKLLFLDPKDRNLISDWAETGNLNSEIGFQGVLSNIKSTLLRNHKFKTLRAKGILIRVNKRFSDLTNLNPPDFGWGKYFNEKMTIHEVRSTHGAMVFPPVLNKVIKLLIGNLDNMEHNK